MSEFCQRAEAGYEPRQPIPRASFLDHHLLNISYLNLLCNSEMNEEFGYNGNFLLQRNSQGRTPLEGPLSKTGLQTSLEKE